MIHRRIARSLRAACLALLLGCPPLQAQVIDRIDVKPGADEAEITIRFAQRIRYLRHAPEGETGELRVFLRLRDNKTVESELMQQVLQVPEDPRVPSATVVYPELRNAMLVRFPQPTPYRLQAGRDGRSIVIHVPLLPLAQTGRQAPTSPAPRATKAPPRPAIPAAAANAVPPPVALARTPTPDIAPLLAVGSGLRVGTALRSVKAQRDFGVVKQGYDYSCGAAALATLLTYGFGDPVDEVDVLAGIIERLSGDQAALVTKTGLSLLDLQQFAIRRGYRAQGFRIRADQVGRLARPVLVFIRPLGYEHFAIFKGVRGDRVLLADPSQGNWRMPLHRFLDMWLDADGQGIVLAVERADGRWPESGPLIPDAGVPTRPELLSAGQMITVRPNQQIPRPVPLP